MQSKSVLFHCNADLMTGFGHLMRCLAIAQEADRRGWGVVVSGRLSERAQELITHTIPRAGVRLLSSASAAPQVDFLIEELRPAVLHFDSYEEELGSFETQALVVSNAQDGLFGRRPATLAIDANLGAENRWSDSTSRALLLLGTDAVQVRDEIRELHHEIRDPQGSPIRMLIVLGGTDPNSFTPRVVASIPQSAPPIDLTVVCREDLHAQVRAAFHVPGSTLTLLGFTKDLPELANQQDIVITAAGTSTWDFAAMGVPQGLVSLVDNHIDGYRACVAAEIVLPLGEMPSDELPSSMQSLIEVASHPDKLAALSTRSRSMIDGKGTWRIVSAWEQLLAGPPMADEQRATAKLPKARPATIEDAQMLLDWRNEPSTRSASRNKDEISWPEHISWLSKTLAREDRKLLIVEHGDIPVGTARWDQLAEDKWEVSITVNPALRGQGLARGVLRAAEEVLEIKTPTQLVAAIHLDNAASRSLFAQAAYLPHLPTNAEGFTHYAKWRFPPK